MSAAHVAVGLASVSLAMSAAALVSCGTLAKRVRAQATRPQSVPRLDLSTVRADSGEGGAESVGECDWEWEKEGSHDDEPWEGDGEGSDDDKENRPPASDWYRDPLSDGWCYRGPIGQKSG